MSFGHTLRKHFENGMGSVMLQYESADTLGHRFLKVVDKYKDEKFQMLLRWLYLISEDDLPHFRGAGLVEMLLHSVETTCALYYREAYLFEESILEENFYAVLGCESVFEKKRLIQELIGYLEENPEAIEFGDLLLSDSVPYQAFRQDIIEYGQKLHKIEPELEPDAIEKERKRDLAFEMTLDDFDDRTSALVKSTH